jgi:hypothetical protein
MDGTQTKVKMDGTETKGKMDEKWKLLTHFDSD